MFDTKKILQLYRCHEKSYEVGRELNTLINQKKSNFNLKDASARRINEQPGKKMHITGWLFHSNSNESLMKEHKC